MKKKSNLNSLAGMPPLVAFTDVMLVLFVAFLLRANETMLEHGIESPFGVVSQTGSSSERRILVVVQPSMQIEFEGREMSPENFVAHCVSEGGSEMPEETVYQIRPSISVPMGDYYELRRELHEAGVRYEELRPETK